MPTRRREIVIIVHGERAGQPELRHVVDWVREKGHRVRVHVTFEAGDAARFANAAAEEQVDAIVAAGGDGTVNEVVNGLGETSVPLGILPVGTANDFAKQIGVPADMDHAMDVILRRRPVTIDTAQLNDRRFINVSSGGAGAEVTAETPAASKRMLGKMAYAVSGMRKLRELEPHHAVFSGPGFRHECDFLIFAVGNGRITGGGTMLTPRARVNDGLLDLCIVEAMPTAELAGLVLRLRTGEHLDHEKVRYVQLPRITVEATHPVAVNVDGEPQELTTFSYRCRPGDLRIFLPHLPGEQAED